MTSEEEIARLTLDERMFVASLRAMGFTPVKTANGEGVHLVGRLSEIIAREYGVCLDRKPGQELTRKDVAKSWSASNLELRTPAEHKHRVRARSNTGFRGVSKRPDGYQGKPYRVVFTGLDIGENVGADGRGKVELGVYATLMEAVRVADTWMCRNRARTALLNLPEEHASCADGSVHLCTRTGAQVHTRLRH